MASARRRFSSARNALVSLSNALHPSENDALQSEGSKMSDQLGTLEKAREELRKQFFSYAQSLSKGFQRAQTYEDVDGVIKIGAAIEALDKAIAASR
jgi:hypothetical protein